MLNRALAPILASSKKSVLVLGPRQTGKSTLIAGLAPDITINLAHEPTFLEFLSNPSELEQRLGARREAATVFIDEVQRLPSLLNTVQVLLDRKPNLIRFYLTGSSARKLKRGQANLLPGRIHSYRLGPLTCAELGEAFDLRKALAFGTLPGIWTEEDDGTREKTLRSYAATYLKEEVQGENLARNLEGFARFLRVAGEWSGEFLDLAKLASTSQVPRQTAVRFFEVLEDCLIVRRAEPFGSSARRRLVQHPRYCFFDGGVLNGLLGNFQVSADRLGRAFEHFIFNQIHDLAAAKDEDIRLTTYRTEHGAEVDFILERGSEVWAIEIKVSRTLRSGDLAGLRSFREFYGKRHRSWVLYLGDSRKMLDGVELWPWRDGLRELFPL
ncbi:MAG: AAA family ATPase [Elusimicrobia bacterium]|nr:AAA family ATPase [Elusimicrobiota bacterium]